MTFTVYWFKVVTEQMGCVVILLLQSCSNLHELTILTASSSVAMTIAGVSISTICTGLVILTRIARTLIYVWNQTHNIVTYIRKQMNSDIFWNYTNGKVIKWCNDEMQICLYFFSSTLSEELLLMRQNINAEYKCRKNKLKTSILPIITYALSCWALCHIIL